MWAKTARKMYSVCHLFIRRLDYDYIGMIWWRMKNERMVENEQHFIIHPWGIAFFIEIASQLHLCECMVKYARRDTSIIYSKASIKLMCLIWSVSRSFNCTHLSPSPLAWLGFFPKQNGLLFRKINAFEIPIAWIRLNILSNYIVDRWGVFTLYALSQVWVYVDRRNALLWAWVDVCGCGFNTHNLQIEITAEIFWTIFTHPSHATFHRIMKYAIWNCWKCKYRFLWWRSWCIFVLVVGVWCRMWNVKNVSGHTEQTTEKIGVNAVHLEWAANGKK